LYERAIYEQTVTFFDKVFHPFLSAFRSGYGCQIALLKIIEDWKKALDENKFVAVILTPYASSLFINNLRGRQSKAFDKSMRMTATNLFSSRAFFQSSIIFRRAIWQP
jgi:hypothetical protein